MKILINSQALHMALRGAISRTPSGTIAINVIEILFA